MSERTRADKLLILKGYFDSREKARSAIAGGIVEADGVIINKPATLINDHANIEIKKKKVYVSRGGFKLCKALDEFGIDISSKIVIDVGASTGGFTQCLLERGAKKVTAVDVGYGQLDWKIRQDPRVEVFERTNIRYFTGEQLGYQADMAVIDVSFISLLHVFKPVKGLLRGKDFEIIALVKPQFEAGKEQVGKGGLVKEPGVHKEVIEKVTRSALDSGMPLVNLTFSPLTGAKGNIEYLIYLTDRMNAAKDIDKLIDRTVNKAFRELT